MKFLLLTALTLSSTALLAQGVPKLTINDELFKEVIELSLTKSPTVSRLDGSASIVATAAFTNRMCSLKLEIKGPNLTVNSSFSRTSKSLEKCKEQIGNYIIKNI